LAKISTRSKKSRRSRVLKCPFYPELQQDCPTKGIMGEDYCPDCRPAIDFAVKLSPTLMMRFLGHNCPLAVQEECGNIVLGSECCCDCRTLQLMAFEASKNPILKEIIHGWLEVGHNNHAAAQAAKEKQSTLYLD